MVHCNSHHRSAVGHLSEESVGNSREKMPSGLERMALGPERVGAHCAGVWVDVHTEDNPTSYGTHSWQEPESTVFAAEDCLLWNSSHNRRS